MLNDLSNHSLFGPYFEIELSKSFTAKQRSKAIFTGLIRFSANIKNFNSSSLSTSQIQPFQGGSLLYHPRGRGQQLFTRAFYYRGKFKFFRNIVSSNNSEPEGLWKCTFIDKNKSFFKEGGSKCTFGWVTKTFAKQLARNNYRPKNPRLYRGLQNFSIKDALSHSTPTPNKDEG